MPGLSFRPLAVLFSFVLTLQLAPAAEANDGDAMRDLLAGTELAGLQDVVAKLTRIDGSQHYGVDIFGAKADLYVYFQDGDVAAPVAVVTLPSVALSTIVPPLKGTAMDIRLDKPILIVATEGYLNVAKMPDPVKARAAEIGFTSNFHVEEKFNAFGLVANRDDLVAHVLKIANLPGPLVAGYASPSGAKIDNPKNPDKKKTLSDLVVSLSLPANAAWENPLFLKDTVIERASVQFRKPNKSDPDPKTQLRINGRARIGETGKGPKEYDLFLEKTFGTPADAESLGMLVALNPIGEVELTDFFKITKAVWATLGFPEQMATAVLGAGHALPLGHIKLRNPYSAKEAFPEEGGIPDFDKVMFAGANPAAEIPDRGILGKFNTGPLLTVNADAKVFGFDAAGLKGAFSLTHGIKLDAKAKLPKLGPITVADAAFDTTVNLKEAYMKLHAEAATVGKFDIDAGKEGLSFEISPQCPDKPVGLVASLSGFDLTKDFSVKPQMKDCLTPIIKDLIEGGGKAVEVAGEIAGEAADEAADIAKTAATDVADLSKKRTEAWGKAIANKTGAKKAVDDAKNAINTLKSAISDLDDKISSLTHSIENLLSDAWKKVSGEVKKQKKARQSAISERDFNRIILAAARQREQQAEKAATDVPVPYHDDALRNAQAAELGKLATMAQQTQFANQARGLTDDLKKPEARQRLFKVEEIAAKNEAVFIAEQKAVLLARLAGDAAGNSKNKTLGKGMIVGPGTDSRAAEILERDLTLGDLVATLGSLEAATQAPIPDGSSIAVGVAGQQLDGLREKLLHQEVPNLPTMAFGKSVLVQTKVQDRTLCLAQVEKSGELGLRDCAVAPEQVFVFSDTGQVRAPKATVRREGGLPGAKMTISISGPSLVDDGGNRVVLSKYDWTYDGSAGNQFFYDPLDGLIRTANGKCLVPAPKVGFGACPQGDPSAAAWQLVEADRFKPDSAPPRAAAGGLRAAAPGAAAVPAVTNLAPLGL
ncbi:MAG: hypothetical protein IH626_07320 [Rhodospirillales bacterium]|nr:hypothetical protein [Rhodospirillales bacterium]